MGTRGARVVAFGLLAGALASVLRAPPGLDLVHVHVPGVVTALLFRAGALLALALTLDPTRSVFRDGVRVPWLLAGALVGFGGCALAAVAWQLAAFCRTTGGFCDALGLRS